MPHDYLTGKNAGYLMVLLCILNVIVYMKQLACFLCQTNISYSVIIIIIIRYSNWFNQYYYHMLSDSAAHVPAHIWLLLYIF